jgi:hypothetical protein
MEGQHEPIAVRPIGLGRIELEEPFPEDVGDGSKRHRAPGCPESAACTASIASARIVLMHNASRSSDPCGCATPPCVWTTTSGWRSVVSATSSLVRCRVDTRRSPCRSKTLKPVSGETYTSPDRSEPTAPQAHPVRRARSGGTSMRYSGGRSTAGPRATRPARGRHRPRVSVEIASLPRRRSREIR